MRIIAALLCLTLVPAAGALAQRANLSEDMGNSDRIICKEITKPGSRIAKSRSCHTAGEWADIRRQQRDNTSRIQSAIPRPGGG